MAGARIPTAIALAGVPALPTIIADDLETAAASNLDLLQYSSASGVWQHVAPSTISIGTATNLAGGLAGSLPYQTGPGATSFLGIGTALQVLKVLKVALDHKDHQE